MTVHKSLAEKVLPGAAFAVAAFALAAITLPGTPVGGVEKEKAVAEMLPSLTIQCQRSNSNAQGAPLDVQSAFIRQCAQNSAEEILASRRGTAFAVSGLLALVGVGGAAAGVRAASRKYDSEGHILAPYL